MEATHVETISYPNTHPCCRGTVAGSKTPGCAKRIESHPGPDQLAEVGAAGEQAATSGHHAGCTTESADAEATDGAEQSESDGSWKRDACGEGSSQPGPAASPTD